MFWKRDALEQSVNTNSINVMFEEPILSAADLIIAHDKKKIAMKSIDIYMSRMLLQTTILPTADRLNFLRSTLLRITDILDILREADGNTISGRLQN